MKGTRFIPLIAGACLIALLPARALAGRYAIAPGEPNLVRFDSKAPAESFSGKTRKISGRIEVNPARLADSVFVEVEVNMATLDTGIELRNRHMRDDHLETATYPRAVFRSTRLLGPSQPALSEGGKTTFTLEGTLTLHGVAQTVQVPVEAELVAKDGKTGVHAVVHFQVKLSDYKVPRPQFLFLRLDEVQRITVDVTGVAS